MPVGNSHKHENSRDRQHWVYMIFFDKREKVGGQGIRFQK